MDDAFILNCCPMVPVGCEEQVVDAKCTRPFLPLVKDLAPRLHDAITYTFKSLQKDFMLGIQIHVCF